MPEIGSTTFSQTDANNTGPLPGLAGTTNPNQIDDAVRALMGAVKREWAWRNPTMTSTGAANTYVLTFTTAPASYIAGQVFSWIAGAANTGACTLNINALGAIPIKKDVGGTLTDPAAGDIAVGQMLEGYYNGSAFVWTNWRATVAVPVSASTTEALTGTDAAKYVTPDALAALWEQGTDVASAATVTLGEGGYFNVTGTTAITDIDFATDKAGRIGVLKFAGALTLTHSATLILPGAANITTAAGDVAAFVSEGADVVRCLYYTRSSGGLSGSVVAVSNAIDGAAATGTAVIPFDDTIPQSTEGTQFMSLAHTPKSAANKLKIDVVLVGDTAGYTAIIVALFKDAGADAISAAMTDTYGNVGIPNIVAFSHLMTAGTTSAITFKVRAGPASADTLTFNGAGGTRRLGGVMASSITVTEIAA